MPVKPIRAAGIPVILAAALALMSCQSSQAPAASAQKKAALNEALKSGVITQQEYDAKVAQLPPDPSAVDPSKKAALDRLLKDGVMTQQEYDAKLRELGALPAAATPVAAMPAGAAPSSPQAPPAGGVSPKGSLIPVAQTSSTGTRHEAIVDPHFNMTAYDVTLPANWKFEGTYVQGDSCANIPFPVVRAYSPDGLTEWRRYPRMDWTWSNLPSKAPAHPDCLNLTQALSGQEFLKYVMGVQQIAYVRDSPVPQQIIDAKQKLLDQLNASAASNARILKMDPAVQTASFAGAFGEYHNGTFVIEVHLLTQVDCIRSPLPALNQRGAFMESCQASLRAVRAPKGQLDGILARFNADRIGAYENNQWMVRYMDEFRRKSEAITEQGRRDAAAAQAIRTKQQEQFMATLKQGTEQSMARATEAANARHTIAQDWVDYSLDQQTVIGTGGLAKVSSAYGHTWTDGWGHYFQSNNPNDNPNGYLDGNWTQATKVHGDGSPY